MDAKHLESLKKVRKKILMQNSDLIEATHFKQIQNDPLAHPLIPPHTGTLVLDWELGGTRLKYCTRRNKKKDAATAMIKEDTIMLEQGPLVSLLYDCE